MILNDDKKKPSIVNQVRYLLSFFLLSDQKYILHFLLKLVVSITKTKKFFKEQNKKLKHYLNAFDSMTKEMLEMCSRTFLFRRKTKNKYSFFSQTERQDKNTPGATN